MKIAINNGAQEPIPGVASMAGVQIRGGVATVHVRAEDLLSPTAAAGTESEFCGASWVLKTEPTVSRDKKTITFIFRSK